MDHVSPANISDDEIDLHSIVLTALRYKWLIICVPVLMAVAVFAFSRLVLPKEYQASALIILTKPVFTTNLDPRIQTSPQVPDIKSLTDLLKADDFLAELIQAPEAQGIVAESTNLAELKNSLGVILSGTNELRLDVTGKDPQRAAQLANLWAKKGAERLNSLFDVDEGSLAQLEQQRDGAHQNWSDAQQALEAYLPENQTNALQVNLEQAKKNLENYVQKINGIDLLISDIVQFEARLAGQSQGASLSLDDGLSLIALQQRGVGGDGIVQVQASGANPLGDDYTVAGARETLNRLASSLAAQRASLAADQKKTEQEITTLATDLEKSKYRLNELTAQRDIAFSAYQALSNQEAETRLSLARNDQVARLASQALPPQEDIGPHSVINAAAAGFLGLVLVLAIVFTVEWWRSASTPVTTPPAERPDAI